MADFDIDAWYRKYHRYPAESTVGATHELRDLLAAYKEWEKEQTIDEADFARKYLGKWPVGEFGSCDYHGTIPHEKSYDCRGWRKGL